MGRDMGAYPRVAIEVLAKAGAYRRGEIELADLQAALSAAADQVVQIDEARDRTFLLTTESHLELMAFTVNSEQLFKESLSVVEEVEAWAAAYLATPGRRQ